MFGGLATGVLGADRRGVGGRLAAALEAHHARRGPGDRVALGVGDGHHGVVEAGVDVRDAGRDVLAFAALDALGFACHFLALPTEILCCWRRRSEEHTSELQALMRISYDVFCL